MSAAGSEPLVSVGMPVYNGEDHIEKALESLLGQDYTNLEIVISDNASTDATRRICDEYAAKDPRIRYHQNPANLGMVRNFNKVFQLAAGPYFMWAAHNDVWERSFVSQCVEVLDRSPSVVVCYTHARLMSDSGESIDFSFPSFDTDAPGMDRISRFHVHIWGITYPYPLRGLMRSSALRRTSLFRDTLGADLVLLTELSLLGAFAYIPSLLFHNRLPTHDDWLDQLETFTTRIGKPVGTKWSALYWYAQLVWSQIQAVTAHVPGYRGRAVLVPSVLLCTLVKYRWLATSLLELSRTRQGERWAPRGRRLRAGAQGSWRPTLTGDQRHMLSDDSEGAGNA